MLACLHTSVFATTSLFDLGDRYFESFEDLESINADIVLDIQQDSSGFIWLATQKGLIRYDGYEFSRYVHDSDDPDSIAGNYIQSIHITDHEMWIGTYSE